MNRIKEMLELSDRDGTMVVTIPLLGLAVLVMTVIILALVIWSIKKRRHPPFTIHDHEGIPGVVPSIAGLTHSDLVEGNKIDLLQDGEFFKELIRSIEKAKESVNFETFLWKHGKLSKQIVDVLCRKAGEGVEVRLLLDGSGGKGIGKDEKKCMHEANIKVETFNRMHLGNVGRLNQRDHRKIVVIDGKVGFVGGHCVVDTWMGDAQDKKHFRDISAKVEGPIVNRIQSAFSENWIEETGEVIAGPKFFPELKAVGSCPTHLAYTTPSGSSSAVELLHYLAIDAAQKQILIQNPYFLPDPEAIKMLERAVERGVEVKVMLPAADASDNALVQHASHHHFGTLLKRGVRIFEYERTLLHQKVMTVDHIWSAVGSTNFDDRSFELNDEVSLCIIDKGIARELEKTFERDQAHAKERFFDEWSRRPLWHKMIDGSAYLINEQL